MFGGGSGLSVFGPHGLAPGCPPSGRAAGLLVRGATFHGLKPVATFVNTSAADLVAEPSGRRVAELRSGRCWAWTAARGAGRYAGARRSDGRRLADYTVGANDK